MPYFSPIFPISILASAKHCNCFGVSYADLQQAIFDFCNKGLTAEDIVEFEEAPRVHKYDEFVPNNLLRKAFAADYLDLASLTTVCETFPQF